MIIPKENRLTESQLREICDIVESFGCRVQEIVGAHRNIYAILGDERHELMFTRLIGLTYVDRVDHIESSYRLLDRESELAKQRLVLGGNALGEAPLFIAGPCTVDPENPELTIETAHAVKEAGAQLLRGGVWKPRTMPYSYQGNPEALNILLKAREQTGLPLVVEVMDERQLEAALEAKVKQLLELSGAKAQFTSAVDNVIAMQRNSSGSNCTADMAMLPISVCATGTTASMPYISTKRS